MSSFEMWLSGGVISIILMLIGVVWNQLNKKHDDHVLSVKDNFLSVKDTFREQDTHIGLLQSKTNDLRADMVGIQVNINNHADKFDEINDNIASLKDMIVDELRILNNKLDNWRERRT
jgi:hypothetical protein